VRSYTQGRTCLTFGLGPRFPITDMGSQTVAQKLVASDGSTTPKQLQTYIATNVGASISIPPSPGECLETSASRCRECRQKASGKLVTHEPHYERLMTT